MMSIMRFGDWRGGDSWWERCGVGMVSHATSLNGPKVSFCQFCHLEATQQMLDLFDILGIANFGIAGNANNSLSIGDVTFPQHFSHTGIWDWLEGQHYSAAVLGKYYSAVASGCCQLEGI
ncbi:uncharacterized protein LOC18786376 [Prunus persica]|uniref:uncharacterized protein LOC18786376 n=1 Tax=Prunus persica TaxID=3760 RepID=UPI0009ABA176|nr:uncharacterized protein LOC18786376 [Prunus persica]